MQFIYHIWRDNEQQFNNKLLTMIFKTRGRFSVISRPRVLKKPIFSYFIAMLYVYKGFGNVTSL